MANRRVSRNALGAAAYSANASGLAVDADDDLLKINVDGTQRPINHDQLVAKSAAYTLSKKESGATIVADSTTSVVVQLPATQAGLKYTLVVGQLTSTGGHAFSPNAADKIMGNGLSKADDADLVCTAASDRVGDAVTLVGDGVDGWYITSVVGTWA